jgi:hypothetical protein
MIIKYQLKTPDKSSILYHTPKYLGRASVTNKL